MVRYIDYAETPPHDIIEQTANTIVSTISVQKSERESTTKGNESTETAAEIEPVVKDNSTMAVTTSNTTFLPQEKPQDVPKDTGNKYRTPSLPVSEYHGKQAFKEADAGKEPSQKMARRTLFQD
ncbi:hypothetical protein Tco_0063299 [Tanacetum coccineum]